MDNFHLILRYYLLVDLPFRYYSEFMKNSRQYADRQISFGWIDKCEYIIKNWRHFNMVGRVN